MHADAQGRLVVTHEPPRARRDYPTLEEALDLMRGRIGVMVELKTPSRYRRHNVVARAVRLLSDADALVCFQRKPLDEARELRPGLRTVQHVGFAVSIRAARDAWAAGFHDARVTPRGIRAAQRLGLVPLVYTVNDERRMRDLAARRRGRHLHRPAGTGSSAIWGTSSLSVSRRAPSAGSTAATRVPTGSDSAF